MKKAIFLSLLISFSVTFKAIQHDTNSSPAFSVIAFYSGGEDDKGHLSFDHEANRWFAAMAKKYDFVYDSTTDWNKLNKSFLNKYQVVIFLDSRPDSLPQRKAFRNYMDKGGAWMGFHFAGFALTPSAFPQNWDWYHEQFLGSGEYKGNTWRPTSAVLRVEDSDHPVTKNLPVTFKASPNEWYSWKNDLRKNPDIDILLAIDSTSFPLGTGPKLHEIWHSGYYPVVWTNRKYRMVYINMGHNDIDYEHNTNKELSFTFNNEIQDRLILNALFWLARKRD
ncbi:MAG TPA: ThuA domain-containing protein [Bacteroidales bacterium]|nr:ThuA domain-containing protein [Bacteroidales bacterium]